MGDSQVYENSECHFVCYIKNNGYILELDGRRKSTINKGKIEDNCNLGIEVSKIIRKYMEIDKGETKFSVMALAPNSNYEFNI